MSGLTVLNLRAVWNSALYVWLDKIRIRTQNNTVIKTHNSWLNTYLVLGWLYVEGVQLLKKADITHYNLYSGLTCISALLFIIIFLTEEHAKNENNQQNIIKNIKNIILFLNLSVYYLSHVEKSTKHDRPNTALFFFLFSQDTVEFSFQTQTATYLIHGQPLYFKPIKLFFFFAVS